MACIPIYPPRGLEILREHIRLARARHGVQDMATPLTYTWKAGTSRPEWGNFTGAPPFGDDPMDQFWIKQGIDYVKQHHY